MDHQIIDDVRPAEQAGEARAYQGEVMQLREEIVGYYNRAHPEYPELDDPFGRAVAAIVDEALDRSSSVDEAKRFIRQKREAIARRQGGEE